MTVEQLVTENLDLVNTLARRAARKLPRWLEIDDLVQSGRIGLLQAAERFDIERFDVERGAFSAYFRAYAARRILGAIYDAHRRKNYSYELHAELDLERHDQPEHSDVAGDVHRGEVRSHLNRAIEDLTGDERYAVMEHALRDVGFAQIGFARDRSTSWAFRQAERGHAKMRIALNRVGIRGVL